MSAMTIQTKLPQVNHRFLRIESLAICAIADPTYAGQVNAGPQAPLALQFLRGSEEGRIADLARRLDHR